MSEMTDRLMDAAENRIRDAGYNGFSFRDLAAAVGIKSASVHHHFPTKAGMAAAVARRYTDRFLAAVGDDKGDPVAVYRSAFRATLAQDARMCLCGVLGAEVGGLPPEVAAEARRFFEQCADDLSSRLTGTSTRSRALHVLATLEGAMIVSRALGDITAFDAATAPLVD